MLCVHQGIGDVEFDIVPFAQPDQRPGNGAVDGRSRTFTAIDLQRRITDLQVVAAFGIRQPLQPPLITARPERQWQGHLQTCNEQACAHALEKKPPIELPLVLHDHVPPNMT